MVQHRHGCGADDVRPRRAFAACPLGPRAVRRRTGGHCRRAVESHAGRTGRNRQPPAGRPGNATLDGGAGARNRNSRCSRTAYRRALERFVDGRQRLPHRYRRTTIVQNAESRPRRLARADTVRVVSRRRLHDPGRRTFGSGRTATPTACARPAGGDASDRVDDRWPVMVGGFLGAPADHHPRWRGRRDHRAIDRLAPRRAVIGRRGGPTRARVQPTARAARTVPADAALVHGRRVARAADASIRYQNGGGSDARTRHAGRKESIGRR